jgi:hypothetical protein
LAAAAFLGGQSRLKAGCGQNCPPSNCKLTHYRNVSPGKLPPEAEIVAAVPPDLRRPVASHNDRRRANRIHGVRVSRPAHDNAESNGSLCLMRVHCQHAQQRDGEKSDFLEAVFRLACRCPTSGMSVEDRKPLWNHRLRLGPIG